MRKLETLAIWLAIGFLGCSTRTVTPGATLLSSLNEYQGEMQRLDRSPERWPDRQRTAGTLKTVVTATVGSSGEFYRMIDLDVRKREFVITMRQDSIRPDRAQEMKDELIKIDEEIATLKPVVRSQVEIFPLSGESKQRIEDAATLGLLKLAVDRFSSANRRIPEARSTIVDLYVITDLGTFATVRVPEGRTYRCETHGVAEEGAAMLCEPFR